MVPTGLKSPEYGIINLYMLCDLIEQGHEEDSWAAGTSWSDVSECCFFIKIILVKTVQWNWLSVI